ncbi:MAG: transcription elongation factor Spt5 [Thaumarchaeota archaeon]|nr:transcription elongation factor Spt5 [Candidatus Geocrenenecus arthurdayi]MCL7389571.1 transcription elongation factor Spt5 [Candidatus Geocrenenecus arthurdayi]MCL7391872.1 transcription elongation factor Spt5 [Candidatus Geocrenenecus arthurdayi]MCL7397250.1 transcription elongation factor Spt5 [Candidatus Geocrenenecus arthurdayi]MCL7401710.1 transcription elongation factor Spt5 [Candidatus Geocrenenecus arthurdayi]
MSQGSPRYFAVKVTVGQERNVARIIESKIIREIIQDGKVVGREIVVDGVYSIIALPNIKGYIFIEADSKEKVSLVTQAVRHVKSRPALVVKKEEIMQHLVEKPVIETISIGDIVEIVAGPLRGIYGRVVRIDKPKNELTIEPTDAAFPLPISISADQVRLTRPSK